MSTEHREIVVVVWDDAWKSATIDINDDNIAEHHKPAVLQTIGWLIKRDETGILIANERGMDDGQNTFRGATMIPKGMIRSVNHFNLTKPRTKKEPNP